MATDEYWISARYAHQGQEKPDQPDNSWDPNVAGYPGFGSWDMGFGMPSFPWWVPHGWWGTGIAGPNLIPNPYAVPGVDLGAGNVDYDYTYPGRYELDEDGYGFYTDELDTYPSPTHPEFMAQGWHVEMMNSSGVLEARHDFDQFESETLGIIGEPVLSSLWLEMQDNTSGTLWHDRFWDSEFSIYFRIFGVNNFIRSDLWETPPWIPVTPGKTYASKVFIDNYYWGPGSADTWSGALNYPFRVAMGVEWYSEPVPGTLEDPNNYPKLGEQVGPEFPFLPDCPIAMKYTYTDVPVNNSGDPWVVPVGTFVAPPGAALAKPFVQLWVDGWNYVITGFYFCEVTPP